MSYEPLHHKYRPKSFAELVGQEAIATTLTNAIGTSKIAPAYLFTGPRGTGKTSSARILAKSLNCLKSDRPTAEPCGVCDVCQGITKGYALDVIEIDAASNTGVDNIRELIEKAQFAPVQCRYKVYVIDECHMLSTQAFNALLKTLEEPPRHVVFVLATTDPQRVLPTIISRCQRFDFRRIQLEAMVKHLSVIAFKENIHISPDAVTLIAQLSQGGLRDAESLLDQLGLLAGEVTPDRVWDLVGTVSEQDLLGLLNAIAQDKPEAVLDCTHYILDRGREPLTLLQNLAAFYRDLLIAKTAPNRHDLVACTQQTWTALVEFAQYFDMSVILAGQKHLREAEVQIKNSTQPRLWLEVTLLGLLPSATNIQPQAPSVAPRVNSPVVSPSYPSAVPQNHAVSSLPIAEPQKNHNSTNNHVAAAQNQPVISSGAVSLPANNTSSSNSVSLPPASLPVPPPATEERPLIASIQSIPPVAPIEQVIEAAQSDLTQVWQQVLDCLTHPGSRALFKEHGRLLTMNDNVAQVWMPPALVKFAQPKSAQIEAAFEKLYQQKIKVIWAQNQSKNASVSGNSVVPPKESTRVQQPPTPSYNQQISPPAPVPQPATPAPVATPAPLKTEPTASNGNGVNRNGVNGNGVNRNGAQTLPPSPQRTPAPDWEVDEVAIAAQRLAVFFNGEIIRFADDFPESSDSITTPEWIEESEVDDE
ncbi:DNA polymerase III subunit gamma/tau [Nostoc sp.]|uniref:DNA polymerase III subunit gamma/tau n=1 Tax=Nostoc sp. TaxID=1180 RepID=UPI002FFD4288